MARGMRTNLLLSMMILLPAAASAQSYFDPGANPSQSLYGIPATFTPPATQWAEAQATDDLVDSGVHDSAPYTGPTTIQLSILLPDGTRKYVEPRGSHGTFLKADAAGKVVDDRARKQGEETQGEVNLADLVLEAWRDDAFRKEAEAMAQLNRTPFLDVVMAPAGMPESWTSLGTSSDDVVLEPGGIEPDWRPMQWAAALGVKDSKHFIRFWILWELAFQRDRPFCEQVLDPFPPSPQDAVPLPQAMEEGFHLYRCARVLGKELPVVTKLQGDGPLGVAQLLLALDREHGRKGLEQAWEQVQNQECATIDHFLAALEKIDPKTSETFGKLLSGS